MRPTSSRAALAALTAATALGAGASSAQAATPFSALSTAKANAETTISDTFAIKPGKVTRAADGTVTLSNSTVLVGDLSGTGVTAKATASGVVLTGGTYVAPTSITENTLKATTPVTVAYSATGVTALSGELTSTKTEATEKQLDATIGEDLQIPNEAVPAAPTSAPWAFKLGLDLQGLSVKGSAGYASLDGRIFWTGGYSFAVTLNGLPWSGGTINVTGSISGKSILAPSKGFALKGSIAGAVQVAPKLQLIAGSVEWGADGFKLSGTARLACTSGYLDATAVGTFTDIKNFSVKATGLASDCTFGQVASFDEKTFDADVTSVNGVLKFDAGFSGAQINLYSKFITRDAEITTYLTNVSGRISNKLTTGDTLRLSFNGTGVGATRDWKRTAAAAADPLKNSLPVSSLAPADREIIKNSFRLQATVAGQFDLTGKSVSKVSLRLSGVKLNFFNFLPGIAMQQTIQDDTIRGFSA